MDFLKLAFEKLFSENLFIIIIVFNIFLGLFGEALLKSKVLLVKLMPNSDKPLAVILKIIDIIKSIIDLVIANKKH